MEKETQKFSLLQEKNEENNSNWHQNMKESVKFLRRIRKLPEEKNFPCYEINTNKNVVITTFCNLFSKMKEIIVSFMVFKIFFKIFIKENTERWKEGTRRRVVSLRFHSFIELFQTLCTDDKTVSRALQSTPTWKTIVRLIWRNVWLGHPVHIQGFVNRTVTHRQRRQRTQLLTIVRLFARYSSGQIDRSSKPLSEGYHLFFPPFLLFLSRIGRRQNGTVDQWSRHPRSNPDRWTWPNRARCALVNRTFNRLPSATSSSSPLASLSRGTPV